MKHWIFLILVSMASIGANAQEKIETDRPDQTESPVTVPKGWLQFELGLQRELQKESAPLYTLPTLLSKYGVSKKLELRLITEYTSLYSNHFTDTFGLLPVKLGFKYNLLEEKGLVPQTSLIVHTAFNRLASKHFKGYTFFSPEFRFTMQHSLTDKLSLGYNVGTEWENGTDEPATFIYTLAPGLEFAENWYTYIEMYGFIEKGKAPEHNMDAGFAYHINADMRADISGGIGLSKNALDHYFAIGFSFRLPASRKARHS